MESKTINNSKGLAANPNATDKALDYVQKLREKLKDESDRGSVLIATANLESALKSRIERMLAPAINDDDTLLDINSPLGDLIVKIELAYRLGLISDQLCSALHKIRRLRNKFAHDEGGLSMGENSPKDSVDDLWSRFPFLSEGQEVNLSSKNKFVEVCSLVVFHLRHEEEFKVTRIKAKNKEWLFAQKKN